MRLVPLQVHHLRAINPQPAQAAEVAQEGYSVPAGDAWAALVGDVPVACGGLIPVWGLRAYAWALIDRDAGPHMRALTREIRSLLACSGWERIEMAVDAEFEAGARWARLLGFELETHARKYLANGRDALVFVRL